MTIRLKNSAPWTLCCLSLALAACGDDGGYGYGGPYEGYPTPPEEIAHPNGEPETCDADAPVTLFLSPDDSNSTSSPVLAREAVLGDFGGLASVPIRTWEFLNYYSFNYKTAERGQVTLTPELTRAGDDAFVLQIGVASEWIAAPDRPLMNLTLVLDESGSMSGEPIELEREVCRQIAGSLRDGDIVSVVGWDTENAIKLAGHEAAGPGDQTLVQVCNGLSAGGGTDLHGGLQAGYALAHEHFDAARVNRVVLVSDGGANAGVTDIDLIGEGAGGQDEEGIYLVGVGVGTPATYNDGLMDHVTDAGRGASLFIPSAAEARKMLHDRFVQTLGVAARDVRVRLDLPAGFSITRFSGEEYSTEEAEIEPQHLAPNDAMVFHQTLETCAPALLGDGAEFTVQVRWKDPVSFAERELSTTRTFVEALADASPMLKKGAAIFAYAEALKAVRDGTGDTAAAFAAVSEAEKALPGDADLAEIRQVLTRLSAP